MGDGEERGYILEGTPDDNGKVEAVNVAEKRKNDVIRRCS